MDPITLWICFLGFLWILRTLVEEGFAAARGHPSPRIARRRERQRLALQRAAITGTPPLTVAISSRLAHRIANPPERRALATARGFLDEVIADSFEDARTRHEEKRRQRMPPTEPARPVDDWPPRHHSPPDPDPEVYDAEWFDTPPDEHVDSESPAPDHHRGPVGEDRPSTGPRPIPAPPPAPDTTTRKDTPPMTSPNIISGDVGSPREALQFCEGARELNAACRNEIEIALAQLRAQKVGQGFLDIVASAHAATDGFDSAVLGAAQRYARHVLTQADLSGDDDLRETLLGYMSLDHV